MDRITKSDLEAVCRRINRTINGTDERELWTRDDDGLHATVGMYHLSGAYGGYSLYRMVNDGGGVMDVLGCGHIAKRDLYDRMQAFLRGVQEINEQKHAQMVPERVS